LTSRMNRVTLEQVKMATRGWAMNRANGEAIRHTPERTPAETRDLTLDEVRAPTGCASSDTSKTMECGKLKSKSGLEAMEMALDRKETLLEASSEDDKMNSDGDKMVRAMEETNLEVVEATDTAAGAAKTGNSRSIIPDKFANIFLYLYIDELPA